MFLFLVVIAAALVVAVLLGGDVRRLARIRLNLPVLLVAAFVVKVAVVFLGEFHNDLAVNIARPLNLLAAALLLAFVLVNWRLPGALLFAAGLSLNLLALIAFTGRMPVLLPPGTPQSSLPLTLLREGLDPTHVVLVARQGLWFIGDIFLVPGIAHSSVVSVGDILMVAAAAWLVIRASRWSAALRRPAYGPSPSR